MPPHPAFLSRVLRLQICDGDFCCGGTIAARAFRRIKGRGCLSELFAFGRLQIPARDIKGGRRRHEHACAHREHTAVVPTPASAIGRAAFVGRLCQTPWRFTETPYSLRCLTRRSVFYDSNDGTGKRAGSSAIETAVPGEFSEAWRDRCGGFGLAKRKAAD